MLRRIGSRLGSGLRGLTASRLPRGWGLALVVGVVAAAAGYASHAWARRRLRRAARPRTAPPRAQRLSRTPAPHEVAALLDVARHSFVSLQQAWDRADLVVLAHVAAEPLFEELRCQLEARGPLPNHTEVVSIEARLLAVEELREAQVASVEFSGLIREQQGERPMPFRELWMLARLPGADRPWQVARVQALS